MSMYDRQAQEFVEKTGLAIDKVYQGHRKYFPEDQEQRAVFNITFTKGQQSFEFEFGQSIQDSYKMLDVRKSTIGRLRPISPNDYRLKGYKEATALGGGDIQGILTLKPQKTPPSDYAILSTIEKHDPETFEDFCSNYDYNTDSRKAMDVYLKVQKQWSQISRVFTPEELEKLREIN